jgi:RnfABCDGE-type electron transport complex B subunit
MFEQMLVFAAADGNAIYWAVFSMLALGGVLGLILAVASKKFHVETDPRIEKIAEVLPNANCGACGLPGCVGYAEAIVEKGVAINLCAPGGKDAAAAIAQIMGVTAGASEPNFATCSCQKSGVADNYQYSGVRDCTAASVTALAGGVSACRFGCLGFGNCVAACPFGALEMVNGLPVVDEEKCTGCKQCVAACPRGLMRVDPESRVVFVQCKSKDKGAVAGKICEHACIACKKCEKECPFDAIHVIDNLAVIDYGKCKNCGKCVQVCPKGVIVTLRAERRERKKAREALSAQA